MYLKALLYAALIVIALLLILVYQMFSDLSRREREQKAVSQKIQQQRQLPQTQPKPKYNADGIYPHEPRPVIDNPTESFLGEEKDRCGGNELVVMSVNGPVSILRNGSAEMFIPSNRFSWYCDGSLESTTVPEGTNYIRVSRGDKRIIYWECYRKRK